MWRGEFSEQLVLECRKSKIYSLFVSFYELPLHDERIGVWCAISTCRIIGPIFYDSTLNAARYVNNILSSFLPS
jgi:hypothetical protein